LEYESAVTPGAGGRLAVDADLAGVPAHKPLDDAQQGGLAATALPDERDDLALVHVEAHPPQHRQEVIVAVLAAAHAERL
jgi:hypothetical protein